MFDRLSTVTSGRNELLVVPVVIVIVLVLVLIIAF